MISLKELTERAERAEEMLRACSVCPRKCGVSRIQDSRGVCRIGIEAVVHSFGAHYGEEPPLVGSRGSGTIFFSGCNLKCIFCQNYETSQLLHGRVVSDDELADMMISLQERGCHNINFVSPTHVVPQILKALLHAVRRGLGLPLVYNCGGYESLETLKLLAGVIDIYMPDIKYLDPEAGRSLSRVADYPEVVKAALREMHNQVGVLEMNQTGIAKRGLLIRHLVLPGNFSGSEEAMCFIASSLSKDSYVNIMAQYRPLFRAKRVEAINRCVSAEEVERVKKQARQFGLWRGF